MEPVDDQRSGEDEIRMGIVEGLRDSGVKGLRISDFELRIWDLGPSFAPSLDDSGGAMEGGRGAAGGLGISSGGD